ncbi:MAG TPA: ABC transporter substrate-binding protein [Acidimicrobiales bacterium]
MKSRKILRVGAPVLAVGLMWATVATAQAGAGTVLNPGQANKSSAALVSKLKENKSLAKLVPARIRKSGTLLVGAQMENAPDDFFSGSSKAAVGFEVNLASGIGKLLGLKVKYLQLPNWDTIVPSVQDGRVDMSMTAMNDTAQRELEINFIDYLVDGVGILVKAGNPENITTPANLCGKNVTDSAGTTQEEYLDSLNAAGGTCASNKITEVVATSTAQEIANLETGRADAILNDNITDAYDQQTLPSEVYSVPYAPINSGPYGIGFPKDDKGLLKAVQGALKSLMAGGSSSIYSKILTNWNVASVAIPTSEAVENGCASVFSSSCGS